MKIRDRYITKTLLNFTLVVLFVWLSIYSFFNFLEELNSIGSSGYSILEAIKYILLQMPDVAYSQASPVILLGCVLGMGHLATTSQIIIFRASGASILNITWLAVKNALFFITVIILIGEFFAPLLTNYAKDGRAEALGSINSSTHQKGFWIRDGDNFINVNRTDAGLFKGITIIEVNSSNTIRRVVKAENALFDGKSLDCLLYTSDAADE